MRRTCLCRLGTPALPHGAMNRKPLRGKESLIRLTQNPTIMSYSYIELTLKEQITTKSLERLPYRGKPIITKLLYIKFVSFFAMPGINNFRKTLLKYY